MTTARERIERAAWSNGWSLYGSGRSVEVVRGPIRYQLIFYTTGGMYRAVGPYGRITPIKYGRRQVSVTDQVVDLLEKSRS